MLVVGRMETLCTASSGFEAQLLAARLGADGFLWELRGNVGGPYPLGPVTVLVPAEQLADARALLLADEVEQAFDGAATDGPAEDGAATSHRNEAWMAAAVIAALVGFAVARTLTVLG